MTRRQLVLRHLSEAFIRCRRNTGLPAPPLQQRVHKCRHAVRRLHRPQAMISCDRSTARPREPRNLHNRHAKVNRLVRYCWNEFPRRAKPSAEKRPRVPIPIAHAGEMPRRPHNSALGLLWIHVLRRQIIQHPWPNFAMFGALWLNRPLPQQAPQPERGTTILGAKYLSNNVALAEAHPPLVRRALQPRHGVGGKFCANQSLGESQRPVAARLRAIPLRALLEAAPVDTRRRERHDVPECPP